MKFLSLKSPIIFLFVALLFFSSTASAQSAGTNQVGVRLGGFSGITFRHIMPGNIGIQADLLANYLGDWTIISVMAEKHIPLGKAFVLYFGGGGFFGGNHDPYFDNGYDNSWHPAGGLQGVLGVDYYFKSVPINVGIDVTPRFSFAYDHFPWDAGASLRYIF
jgi:hypothetical protein